MATDTMQLNFANGWGVSIIDHAFSRGLELAVLKDGRLHYANPVACGDTQGWLTDEQVEQLVAEVSSWKQDQIFPEWEDEEE
jgi:hypothetical protein